MAKCKDCLHYEACSAFSKIINVAVDVEKGCEHFKDHTDVVEVVRCKNCFANGCCSVQIDLDMGDEGYCPKGRKG